MCFFKSASFVVVAFSAVFAMVSAHAEVTIDINHGTPQPMPIALPSFSVQGGAAEAGAAVNQIISDDLERSGLFAPINKAAFIQQFASINDPARFGDWRAINATILVQGEAAAQPDGQVKFSYRLFDVFAGVQMDAGSYTASTALQRRIAHKIADAIYSKVTSEKGYFDSRVVYVAESGTATKPVKRLAIMDQDGANPRFLSDGSFSVLSPRFSPSNQEITYMSDYGGQFKVYLFNLDTGQQRVLGEFSGISFAPRFSPNGKKVIFSIAHDGVSNLYEMDLASRQLTRLTNHPGADTSPSYSPDGSQIVFESDRGGAQQIYVMNADGSNPTRISYGDGRYAEPVWSPRGDYIAFTKIAGGQFYIGVMKPDGKGERELSSSFLVEGPTWSPNGRVIMFDRAQRNGGRSELMSIDLTGRNERKVVTPTGASDAAWSPLLP